MKHLHPICLFSIAAVFLGAETVEAKPMPPFALHHEQSDGDTLAFKKFGDEYENWAETLDGYVLAPCEKDLCYANAKGESSGIVAKNAEKRSSKDRAFLNGLDKKDVQKAYREKQPKKERRPYGTYKKVITPNGVLKKPVAESWTQGEQTFLMVLVNHSLKTWTTTAAANFKRMLNEEGYSDNGHFGSVRDYYIKQSGGKFKPTFKVIGPYAYNGSPSGNDANVMREVLAAAYSSGDLTSFDGYAKNSNGTFVGLVLAGNTAEYGMDGTIYMGWMMTNHSQGSVGRYVYIPGMSDSDASSVDGMGTFAHEFGHVLGLPDLYQTSTEKGTFRTPKHYDVMDVGCYNNSYRTSTGMIYGNHVPNMSSLEREWLGWHTPTNLSSVDGVYSIPAYDANNFAYQIVDPSDSDQWFVLENRQQQNWDASLPGHGLLIWHIDYNQTIWDKEGVNNGTQYVDIEEADGTTTDESAATFPGTSNVTSFDNFNNWSGQKLFNKISGITEQNGYICFAVGNATVTSCPATDTNVSSSSGTSSSSVSTSSSSSVNAVQQEFVYTQSIPIQQGYQATTVPIENDVLQFLGIQASQLSTLFGNGLDYFVLNANGVRITTSTANAPGNWFDASGNSILWDNSGSFIYSEVDLANASLLIGNYPDRVSNGSTVTIRQGLSYQNKEAVLKSTLTFIDEGSTILAEQGLTRQRLFENGHTLSEFSRNALAQGSRLHIYDLKGNRVLTIRNSTDAEALRALGSGAYQGILLSHGKSLEKEFFRVVK